MVVDEKLMAMVKRQVVLLKLAARTERGPDRWQIQRDLEKIADEIDAYYYATYRAPFEEQ